jgi:hypothetical protein
MCICGTWMGRVHNMKTLLTVVLLCFLWFVCAEEGLHVCFWGIGFSVCFCCWK